MLQKVDFQDEALPVQEDLSFLLRPGFYWQVFRRRWFFFLVPFVLVLVAGVSGALVWPPTYLAEGKILVQSQQIPSELVRSTVTSAAQERIQVIQQRTMTRDNLIAIADKFKLFPDKRSLMSPTELVEAVRKGTKIAPVDPILEFKQKARTAENPTIIFSIGFEYDNPVVAAQVANELMTRILSEDLRDRTARATETTKFLAREVQKLQADNAALEARIAQLRLVQGKSTGSSPISDPPTALNQLKAELMQKSALYSERHPLIQTLKKQIEALEKSITASPPTQANQTNDAAMAAASLEALEAQQESLQKSLDVASAKLLAARLGENLEKDQQSEKLEVVESPTVPQEPVKPNRFKIMMLSLAGAVAAGLGVLLLAEISDKTIRRSNQLLTVVGGSLVISIPYIVTAAERREQRRKTFAIVGASVVVVVGLLIAAYLLLPPLDLLIAKARVGLYR